MGYRVWYSTESLADYIIDNTDLSGLPNVEKKKMYESDANNPKNFHSLPDHIKKILYLDAPDLIVEKDLEPIFSLEISTEAGTGHNAFKRFPRIAASIENNVPAFYIYPDAVIVHRPSSRTVRWDKINPLVFKALRKAMNIYNIPALLYYFPTDLNTFSSNPQSSPNIVTKGLIYDSNIINYAGCPDSTSDEMQKMFEGMNAILAATSASVIDGRNRAIRLLPIVERIDLMEEHYHNRAGTRDWSPLTSVKRVPTSKLIDYLSNFHTGTYTIGELLRSRDETIIYCVNARFRGDPYPGALAAIDYLITREGKTFEERYFNLVLAWGDVEETNTSIIIDGRDSSSIESFCTQVASSESRSNILHKAYSDLSNEEISRYYMQVRYGSSFSKVKHIRVFSYFADAILFADGALWRDG